MFSDYINVYIQGECPNIGERDVIVQEINIKLVSEYKQALVDLKEDIKKNKGIHPELEPEQFQSIYSVKVMELHKEYVSRIPDLVAAYDAVDFDEEENEN